MTCAKSLLTSNVTAVLRHLESRFKAWITPHTGQQLTGIFTDLTHSKTELIAENAFLLQQLIVLQRQIDRPQLAQRDRRILVLLASRLRTWKDALFIVQPETLLKWHRQGFRVF